MSLNLNDFTGLAFFSASWAGEACDAVRQVLTALKGQNASLQVVEVEENDENDALFNAFNIEAVPVVLSLSLGKEVARVVGFQSREIAALLQVQVSNDISKATPKPFDLKELINQSPLMLFIKGTPEAPQCGFTGQLIRLLAANGLESSTHYRTFNILKDDYVRQALKEYSQWPTYPQIYWHGELVGGLDILKEMFATGQMDSIISELKQESK